MLKTHKNPPEILAIFVNTMIKGTNMLLVEKAEHLLFELPASLTGDNFHECNFLFNRLLDDAIEFSVNFIAAIINIMKVEF